MRRQMFKSKIHRAVVTQADVDYEGSVTVDENLLEAADILEHEAVHVWNVTRGTRFMTYALKAPRGSGIICVNGAAAHLARPTDKVIIATFCEVEEADARRYVPRVVLVDEHNAIREKDAREVPGPLKRVV